MFTKELSTCVHNVKQSQKELDVYINSFRSRYVMSTAFRKTYSFQSGIITRYGQDGNIFHLIRA